MLHKEITETIINEADKTAIRSIITGINIEDNVVTVNLFDSEGSSTRMVARKRVYSLDNIPFNFQTGDLEYLKGEVPDIKWNVPAIKAWLADHQVGEEEMAVDGDPYLYMSETELLELVASITEEKE